MIVDELRKSILNQAICGKLTIQEKNDLSAKELKNSLIEIRKKLIENKKILRKTFLCDDAIHPPFEIPDNWCWVYLSNISIIQEGAGIRKHQYKTSGIQLLSVTNILDGSIDLRKKQIYVSESEYNEKYMHLTLNKGDIVTACSGGSWGKVAIYDLNEKVMLNTSTLRLRFFNDLGNNKYLYYLLKSNYFKRMLSKQLAGIQPNFGYAHYSTIPIPLPPIKEQQRIVNKIEELFAKLDELNPIEEKLSKLKASLPIDMNKSIINYAIHGKLSKQNLKDLTVDTLIPEETLLKDNYKKFNLKLDEKDYPYQIPQNWKWVKLGMLFDYQNGYPYKPSETIKNGKGHPVIKSQNIMKRVVEINSQTSFVENPTSKMLKAKVNKGDFLMCLSSQSNNPEPLGKTAIYEDDDFALLNQRVLKLIPINHDLSKYLYYVINSFYFHNTVSHKGGGSAQSNLKLEHVMEMYIPLPPLEEQKRIVDKLEELLPLCDDIEKIIGES